MAHFNLSIGASSPALARSVRTLFARAGIASRAQLRAWVMSGSLPVGATITAAVFSRALLALGAGVVFRGETDDEGADAGIT